jgi:polyphenol oxidase
MITLPWLSQIAPLRHGFFTRQGGVSLGIYGSRNCGPGSSDNPDHVAQNRAQAMNLLGRSPDDLVTVRQAHTSDVVVVDRPFALSSAPTADALVTDRPGIVLGILTADCAPILFADKAGTVIAAAHAGWKGALHGVIEATIRTMTGMGVQVVDLIGVVGPCIAQQSYEVGPEFPAPFLAEDPASSRFFVPASKPGHWMFDLRGYAVHRMIRAGMIAAHASTADTYGDESRFFSYRRTTLQQQPDYGRQLSAIVIDP